MHVELLTRETSRTQNAPANKQLTSNRAKRTFRNLSGEGDGYCSSWGMETVKSNQADSYGLETGN